MKLERARSVAAHAAVGFAFVSITAGGDIPSPALIAFAAAWASSLLLNERLKHLRGSWMTALAGAALLALSGAWLFGTLDLVVAASLFAATMCANRLLARTSAADDGLLYLSALLMLAGGAALSAELLYGLCFAGFTLTIVAALTLSHLEQTAVAGGAAPGSRSVGGRALGALVVLAVAALVGAIGGFFVMPRFTTGVYVRPGRALPNEVGFSGELRLDAHGRLKSSPRTALRVNVDPEPRQARLDWHWRGLTFDSFDGIAWHRTPTSSRSRNLLALGPDAADALKVTVEVLPTASASNLFLAGDARTLLPPRRLQPGVRGPRLMLDVDAYGDVRLQPEEPLGFGYELRTVLRTRESLEMPEGLSADGRNAELPEELRERYLQLPAALDPRIPELARRWTAGIEDPWRKASALESALSSHCVYTTDLPEPGPDPVARFLFETRRGHCEYFSTAMTLLLRAAGVPARNATGYFGGFRPAPGEPFLVRSGDAHSWSEAWFPGRGFVAFDPTPEEGRPAATARWLEWLVERFERTSRLWQNTVVDYSLFDQVRAAGKLFQAASGLGRLRARSGAGVWSGMRFIAAAAILVLAAWSARRLWRETGTARPRPIAARHREVVALYRAMVRRAARRGLSKGPAQTPREFARAWRASNRRGAAAVDEITERYLEARFGSGRLERRQLRELRRRLREL